MLVLFSRWDTAPFRIDVNIIGIKYPSGLDYCISKIVKKMQGTGTLKNQTFKKKQPFC